MSRKINTYEPTDVNYQGGLEYGANIHSVSVQINQDIWDMIKTLNENDLYGFDFESKIGTKKVIVTLRHEDKELLEKGKKLLVETHDHSDFLFLVKLKKKEESKMVWIVLALVLFLSLIGGLLYTLYQNKIIFDFNTEISEVDIVQKEDKDKELVIQDIVIDMDKLKAFKDSFEDENSSYINSIDAKTMQVLEITTSVIASFVSEEEKEKYSTKNFIKNFKGKSGIRFVAKDGNLSKDFNATVKELNQYAKKFIEDSNISLAIQCFDKALENNSTNKDEILMTLANQGEMYENIGQSKKAKESYSKILELSKDLTKEEISKYGLVKATVHAKLSDIYRDFNKPKEAEEESIKAEDIYKNLLSEFRKKSKSSRVNQAQLAWALNYLANFYSHKKEYVLSIEIREEAIKIYKKLGKKSPKQFAKLYYKTVNSQGNSYLLFYKIERAKEHYKSALSFAKRVLKDKSYNALSFRALAMVYIKQKKFTQAEEYYNDALKIYKKLVRKNSKLYSDKLIEIYSCFAYLEKEKSNYILAKKRYQKIILDYKKMNIEEPLKYNLQIIEALNSLANIEALHLKNPIEAEMKLFEALSISKKVKEIEKKRLNKLLVKTYRTLAYLATIEKNMQSALDYYRKAESFDIF